MAYRGDLIICLVDFDKLDEESRVPINFTLNGALIHEALMKYEKGKKELYPFIGMCHKGIRVLAKVRKISPKCKSIIKNNCRVKNRELFQR